MMRDDEVDLARMVRDAVVKELIAAHEEAGMLGLCHDGRIDYALDRARHVDVAALVSRWHRDTSPEVD